MNRDRLAYILGWLENFSFGLWVFSEMSEKEIIPAEYIGAYDNFILELKRELLEDKDAD